MKKNALKTISAFACAALAALAFTSCNQSSGSYQAPTASPNAYYSSGGGTAAAPCNTG